MIEKWMVGCRGNGVRKGEKKVETFVDFVNVLLLGLHDTT